MSKTFEEHVAAGTNNSLEALEALANGMPKYQEWLIATGKVESQAGLREDISKVLTTTIVVKTPQERLKQATDNLKRNGGKLDCEIKHPNDLTPYQMEQLAAVQNWRANPRSPDVGLDFDSDGHLINPFTKPGQKFAGQTRWKNTAIAMQLEIR